VFVVGYLGDWRRAAAVLFERASLSGHPAPRREAGEGVTGCFTPGAHPGGYNGQDAYNDMLIAHSLRGDGFDASEDGTGGRAGIGCGAVAFDDQRGRANGGISVEQARTLHGAKGLSEVQMIASPMQVRRLTPRECERLQGFPDDYTLIPYRGKLAADGPRYKALGNSMAVPVMRWIGERIARVDGLTATSPATSATLAGLD